MNILTNKSFIALVISSLLTLSILIYLLCKKNKSQIQKYFTYTIICTLIISIGVIIQSIFCNLYNIDPIYFEMFIYMGTCFLPVYLFLTSKAFSNTVINITKKYLLLFVIPIISIVILYTNDIHHLFFVKCSLDASETLFGPYFYIHTIYTYVLLIIALINFLRYTIKNSGFFSNQSVLIIIGSLIPIVLNILGTFNIIVMSIYMTPISFALTMLFFAIAIFKFNFLNIAPIALQKVVDRISDGYLVLDTQNCIIDFNQTFLTTFRIPGYELRGKNFYTIETLKSAHDKFKKTFEKLKTSAETFSFEQHFTKPDMFFRIEINSIYSKNSNLGTLVLFKDITQHINDINTIQNKQDQLVEQERLASLGQMIGGIAHNLKTPIMSISGAAEGINDLINEFDASIGNPIVTEEDFHDIAKDMTEWTKKIKSYTEYMSDVITAVKGQATNLSNDTEFNFTITELFKRVNILMKHELKKAVVYLNITTDIDENTTINGDINSLVQVINNMISNAIQSYNGTPEKEIDLSATKQNNNIVISIKDYGPGLPAVVKDKLFKEMVTTKGKNGTGLGLYMSYSNIKAHFNGNITFDTKTGEGTTFNIIIPL